MDSDRSDRSDGSDRSDSSDDVSDLEPLPKRVRQTTHCENLSGKEKRDSDIALSPNRQLEEHGAKKLQSMHQTPARELEVPHGVEKYRTFLTDTYECAQAAEDQWPSVQFEYIKLATVVKKEDFMKEDDCTRAMMNGKLQIVLRNKQSIAIEKIGRFEDGTLASCIIVQGIPGVGKSTLAWQLGRRWGKKEILQHFQLVIVLCLRDERVQKARTILKLLYHPDPKILQSVSNWIASTWGENVLLILDGYDELSSELQTGDLSIFARIIKGKELPKLTVLVTSRPSANENLYQLCACRVRKKCQYIEVVGFGEKEIREYVEQAFKPNLHLKESFNLYIKQRPHILSMMYVPINCAIVVDLFKEHKGKPPQTLTEVYTALTNTLLRRHEKKPNEKAPVARTLHTECHELVVLKKHYSDLVGTIQDPAGLAGLLYSRGIICPSVRDKVQERVDLTTMEKAQVLINAVEKQVTADPSKFQVFMEVLKEDSSLSTIVKRMSVSTVKSSKMTCFEGLSSTTLDQLLSVAKLAYQGTLKDQLIFHNVQDNIETLGLLQKVPQLYSTSSPQASYNFIHKTLQEFLTAWYVSSRPTSEQRVFVKDSLTKPNMAMTVRFMAGLTKFQTSSENMDDLADIVISLEKRRLVESLHCMFETQNPTFIQRLMGNKEQTLNLSVAHLNPFDLYALGYCIVNSSSTLWSLNLGFCNLTDECMRMLFLVEDRKAFDHITSLDLTGNREFMTTSASLLGMMLKENNTLKKLDLYGCELQPEGLEQVMKGVQANTKLETLVLSRNIIDNKRASCLGMMLKGNTTLKRLDLRVCGLEPEGLEEVMKGVEVNTKLETLDLSENIIDNKRASCLGMMLKGNTTLKRLDLHECGLEPEGLEEVMKCVEVNTKLETLDLSNYIIDNKRASCLGMMLKGNTTLKGLYLRECGLQPEGLEEVMKGVEVNTMFETLDLSKNIIDNKRASCLGMMLKGNTTLKLLGLDECGLQPEGLEEVMKRVEVNTKLETLYLSENIIDNKRASCLAHVLNHNTTLSELRLRWCDLKDEAICELCGGLKWCRLKILNLYGNPFGDQGAKGLADVLKDHPTLEELSMWGCKEMSDDGVQHLMDAMMSNTRVKMLGLSSKYNGLTVPKELVGRIQYI